MARTWMEALRARGERATRRGMVRSLASLPLSGALASVWPHGASEAKRKRKKKRRKHKRKKTCGKAGRTPVKGKCCAKTANLDSVCQRCDVCASGCDFASIQAAIDAADPGATIAVCPGTYRFQNLLISHDVRLVGAGDGQGSGDTIVQGTGDGSVVTIDGGDVKLEQLRLTGGGGGDTFGGGLYNATDRATVLIGCTVSGNTAASGGGIYNSSSILTMIGCTVSRNAAVEDGGGGIAHVGGTLSLTDCTVSGNEATDTTLGYAGGIANEGGVLILTGSKVSGNTAAGGSGGGISNPGGTLSLVASEVSGNSAVKAGGIWNGINLKTTLDAESRVTGNTAGTEGGGIYNSNGTVSLASSENVTGNTPSNCAGTVPVAMCSG